MTSPSNKEKKCPTPTKLVFKDERKAWLKAFKLFMENDFDQSPYKCPCGRWHLTNKPKKVPDFLVRIIGVYKKFGVLTDPKKYHAPPLH